MTRSRPATSRRNKTFAILAGGTLVGVAVTATLAAWTDTEWIFGGDGAGGPGIGTSSFEVQQNTVAPFAAGTWTDEEENPGGEIVFGLDALDLSPGETVYAPFALRAAPGSDAGDVVLQPAVVGDGITFNDPDGDLFAALEVSVATDDAAFACDVDAFDGGAGDPAVIADGPLGTTGGSAAQALLADAGSTQYYCFAVTLPDPPVLPAGGIEDLMGLTLAPAWQFLAETA